MSDGFLKRLHETTFEIDQLKNLYVSTLRVEKTEQKMINSFDEHGSEELSTDAKPYLKKTEVGLEIIEKIIQYILFDDKSDFNHIIYSLKSSTDQPNDDHLDDLENPHSTSSHIVDVSEDDILTDNEKKPIVHRNLLTCDCGKCYRIEFEAIAVNYSQGSSSFQRHQTSTATKFRSARGSSSSEEE